MDDRSDTLEERVRLLERRMDTLQDSLSALVDTLARRERLRAGEVTAGGAGRPLPAATSPVSMRAGTAAQAAGHEDLRPPGTRPQRDSQYWLNRIGIGLLLFGVAFLFKYSVDQGWLTESVRVAVGLGLGAALLVVGARTVTARPWFGRALFRAAIAAFYITGFAAFQLYDLVGYVVAFGFMMVVTLLAFGLALRQNAPELSVIAAAGALATPFLLYSGESYVARLAAYTSLVLLGTGMVYLDRGWRSLLWTSVVGGWAVLLVASMGAAPGDGAAAVQLAVIVALATSWLLPVARALAAQRGRDRWQSAPSGHPILDRVATAVPARDGHLLAVAVPLLALGLSTGIWRLSSATWGWIAVIGAAGLLVVAWAVYRIEREDGLGYAHAVSATVLLTVGAVALLDGAVLLVALAFEGLALHLIARRVDHPTTSLGGHAFHLVAMLWLADRLFGGAVSGMPLLNGAAVGDLAVIGLTALAGWVVARSQRTAYLLAAHGALLAWLWRELLALPNGNGFVTIAWGVYAIVLLVLALLNRFDTIRRVAMATLLLVVGKLFLVDLARVEALWRIMLFLGFGALFIVLSYYFGELRREEPEERE
jgi:uncharacterized membrane protein